MPRRTHMPIMHELELRSLPMAALEPHEGQALVNHGQTLHELASRGGLDVTEALAILEDRRWTKVDRAVARARIAEILEKTT